MQDPYISPDIADSPFTRASFVTEALVSQNGVDEDMPVTLREALLVEGSR